MQITRSSVAIALAAPLLACGCFALFSLDDYGPNGGIPDAAVIDADIADAAVDVDAAKGPRILFVTRGRFTGALGGVTGADERCTAAAADAGLGGAFVAWLGTGASSGPASRISDPQRAIDFPNKVRVAANLDELAATGPREPILVTETAAPIPANGCAEDHVWTNARANGSVPEGGLDCNAWSAVSGGGGAGQLGGAHDDWAGGCFARSCEAMGHLYCVQK